MKLPHLTWARAGYPTPRSGCGLRACRPHPLPGVGPQVSLLMLYPPWQLWRRCVEDQRRLGLEYRQIVRKYHTSLRKSNKSASRVDISRVRKECARSFWKFVSKVLDGDETSSNSKPSFESSSAQVFFTRIYSSHPRSFDNQPWFPIPPDPHTSFDNDDIQLEELQYAIRKSKYFSSPSPFDQVPYSIIKRCPVLVPALLDIYNHSWHTYDVPPAWKRASITLIPKGKAQEDPTNPANFRPIALTSCIGKLFSTILKNRLLNVMTSNGFLDTSTQKAFMPSVPGCIEHYAKLATAVHEAHVRHKSLTVSWLDLANAYGSVHHNLISFSLHHYHNGVSDNFSSLVANFYSGLSASVYTQDWSSPLIPINKGIFQGDPLSVIIFNTVKNTYIDAIKPHLSSSYHFTNSSQLLGLLQYADDTCLVSDGPASSQILLDMTDQWLKWSGMQAKIPKCQCLAIKAGSGQVYDPNLMLSGAKLPLRWQ